MKGGKWMAKRKAERNAVEKYSKTPKENVAEQDFSAEFAVDEDPAKGANRNSKKGRGYNENPHNENPQDGLIE